jgi:hypothetical protein
LSAEFLPKPTTTSHSEAQRESKLTQFATLMHHHFGGLWVSQQAPSPEDLRVNLQLWGKGFSKRSMTMADIEEVLLQATTETCPFPTPVHFFGLWDKLQETARGHASFRPASEVMAAQQGAKAHALLPQSEAHKAKRKRVGREHLAHLLMEF